MLEVWPAIPPLLILPRVTTITDTVACRSCERSLRVGEPCHHCQANQDFLGNVRSSSRRRSTGERLRQGFALLGQVEG